MRLSCSSLLYGMTSLVLVSFLGACATSQPALPPDPMESYTGSIADLNTFPQSMAYFAQQQGKNTLLMSAEQSQAADQRFDKLYFQPWQTTKPSAANIKFFKAELGRKGEQRGYAENLLLWDPVRWASMVENAQMERCPSMVKPAIVVRNTNLRAAPTAKPRFEHPLKPGQGYPFDLFQQSALPVGTPVVLFHATRRGDWVYAETSLACGWLASADVAVVDQGFQDKWMTGKYAVFVEDDVPLGENTFQNSANIGTILPLVEQMGDKMRVLTVVRNTHGQAVAVPVLVNKGQAEVKPLPLTMGNLAQVADRMLGQPYGWGGMNDDRDCSQTIHDLFAPFGLWLPRNSASQAKVGAGISFDKLSVDERLQLIAREGQPFMTLLYMPGHIGLYVGQYKGQPAFFHNIWGVRTEGTMKGASGRHILGRAVITSTMPGRELPDVLPDYLLLKRMKNMTILGR